MGTYEITTDGGTYQIDTEDQAISAPNAPQSLSTGDALSFVGKSAALGIANLGDMAVNSQVGATNWSQDADNSAIRNSVIQEMVKRGISPETLNSPQGQALIDAQTPHRTTLNSLLTSVMGSPYDLGGGQQIVKTPTTEVIKAAEEGSVFPGGQIANAMASGGSEIAHQIAPDSVAAPFIGALGGGGVASLGGGLRSLLSGILGPQTEASAAKTAAETLGRVSGVTGDDVATAIANNASDPLAASKTSAELLANPKLAILEQSMGTAKPFEMAAGAQARSDAANTLLSSIASKSGALPENTGATIQDAIGAAKQASSKSLEPLYDAIPAARVPSDPIATEVLNAIDKHWGPGSPPKLPKDLSTLLEPLFTKTGDATAEELKNARTHLIQYKEALGPGTTQESAIASAAIGNITNSLLKSPKAGAAFDIANTEANLHHELFGTGPLSKIAGTDASKVVGNVLASPESATKAFEMIGNNPKAIQAVKDQIASDLSGLSDTKRINFITDNESELKTLLPKSDFDVLDAIRKDAKTRIDTQASANVTRGSNTALKLSGVIQRALTGKEAAKEAGLWGQLVKGAGLGGAGVAAFSHPAIAIPAIAAAAGVKALRGRSASLVQDALYNQLKNPEALQSALEAVPAAKQPLVSAIVKGVSASEPTAFGNLLSQAIGANGGSSQPSTPAIRQALSSVLGAPKVETPKILSAKAVSVIDEIKKVPEDHAIALLESSMNPNAKNPDSTASGLFQLTKGTAEKLGVNDVFDAKENYAAYKKLKADTIKEFGSDDVATIYASHYLGAPTLQKVFDGKPLTTAQAAQVKNLKDVLIPRLMKIYNGLVQA